MKHGIIMMDSRAIWRAAVETRYDIWRSFERDLDDKDIECDKADLVNICVCQITGVYDLLLNCKTISAFEHMSLCEEIENMCDERCHRSVCLKAWFYRPEVAQDE